MPRRRSPDCEQRIACGPLRFGTDADQFFLRSQNELIADHRRGGQDAGAQVIPGHDVELRARAQHVGDARFAGEIQQPARSARF